MQTILHFYITKEDNSYSASCVEHAIVTQADTLDELVANIQEATELHFDVDPTTAKATTFFDRAIIHVVKPTNTALANLSGDTDNIVYSV